MKSIGRTIDRIIRIDPALAEPLEHIKAKDQKYPSRKTSHWKELLKFLNSEPLMQHPKRSEIAGVVQETKKRPNPVYTFDNVGPGDRIIGILPEHMADYWRRHDIKTIRLAKMQVEANMTRNVALAAKIARLETLLDISVKKMWLTIKDHFDLWSKPSSFYIKKDGPNLVMVEQAIQQMGHPRVLGPFGPGDLRNFLRMLGLEPPQDGDQGQP